MYDIVGKRRWYFLFSALITIPGLVFIALGGLKPSIDFTGGTVWQVRFADDPGPEAVQVALVDLGHAEATVEVVDSGFLEIRLSPIEFPVVGGIPPPPPPAGGGPRRSSSCRRISRSDSGSRIRDRSKRWGRSSVPSSSGARSSSSLSPSCSSCSTFGVGWAFGL